jgi:chromosome segregation ATPase
LLTTLTEIQELKNQCEQKDNEINDVQESLEEKQRVIDDNLDTIDSSRQLHPYALVEFGLEHLRKL